MRKWYLSPNCCLSAAIFCHSPSQKKKKKANKTASGSRLPRQRPLGSSPRNPCYQSRDHGTHPLPDLWCLLCGIHAMILGVSKSCGRWAWETVLYSARASGPLNSGLNLAAASGPVLSFAKGIRAPCLDEECLPRQRVLRTPYVMRLCTEPPLYYLEMARIRHFSASAIHLGNATSNWAVLRPGCPQHSRPLSHLFFSLFFPI
ncbi:hypothetical protein V8C35DRAFT_223916 [Trichoderma chlorosporum]